MKSLKILVLIYSLAFTGSLFASEVDINTSDAATIAAALKGIGMKKAEAIVAYRESNGPFTSVDELVNVRGIGEKTVEKIRDSIILGSNE